MKKLALTIGFASALILASVPAKASGHFLAWPWGFLGFEAINFGVTQGILVVCHGQIASTPQGLLVGLVPIYGPIKALESCPKPKK